MIKLLWIFVLSPLFLLSPPGAPANAEDPDSLTGIETAFSSCVAALDSAPRYAPLAVHGFLAPPDRYSQAQLTDPDDATATEAALVANFQAAEGPCEVALRIDLMNVDAALSDLASQRRQLTDVNELLVIDGKENWGQFSTTRVQVAAAFQQASAAAIAGAATPAAPAIALLGQPPPGAAPP